MKTGDKGTWAVPIDQDMLDLLEIEHPGDLQLEVEVKNGTLVITPVGGKAVDPEIADEVKLRERFEQSLSRVNERFASALERLSQ